MTRPTHAIIDREALRNNLRVIRSALAPGTRIMAVVKANCYGHHAALCVPELLSAGADLLAVATIEEAAHLRSMGINGSIVVLAPALDGQYAEFAAHGVEALVSNARTAEYLSRAAMAAGRELAVHLFIDTGMGRNGTPTGDVLETLRRIESLPGLRITGFASHFATSDEPENPFTLEQIALFDGALRAALDAGFRFRDIHLANSGGILNFPSSHYTVVRPGLSLYGHHPTAPAQKQSGLMPVMRLRTVVANITLIPRGRSISYGRRYFTASDSMIATLPIGYADGLMRTLTNRLDVLIGGRRYPVVGTICMDEVMVDLGDGAGISIGDEAVLIGRSGEEIIEAWELAGNAGTIPYEICTNISARVPRIGG